MFHSGGSFAANSLVKTRADGNLSASHLLMKTTSSPVEERKSLSFIQQASHLPLKKQKHWNQEKCADRGHYVCCNINFTNNNVREGKVMRAEDYYQTPALFHCFSLLSVLLIIYPLLLISCFFFKPVTEFDFLPSFHPHALLCLYRKSFSM